MAQRSQMNAKEKLGREIDLTNASKDELIEHLCKIIEYEVEKGDDADCDLVRECSDWLDKLTEDEVTFTPEELERKLAQMKAGSESKKPVKICKKAKLKTFVRVALIAAVIFAISLVSLSAVAMNKGYGSAWEYVSENIREIFDLTSGEEITESGISVTMNTGTIEYNTVDEFIKSCSLNILYPHLMPDKVKIAGIHIVQEEDGKYLLSFIISNPVYVFNITNYSLHDVSCMDTYQCLAIDDLYFYYTQIQDNTYYAILQYEGFEYTIQTPNYDDLLIIINSMKG